MQRQVKNPDQIYSAIVMYKKGDNLAKVGRALGVPRTTVQGWIEKFNGGQVNIDGGRLNYHGATYDVGGSVDSQPVAFQQEQPSLPQTDQDKANWNNEMEQFNRAALHSPAVREQTGANDRPDVIPKWEADDVAMLWDQAEKKNEKAVNKALNRSKFDVKMGNDPVGICFVSDQHISVSNSVCLRRMRQDAELIAETDGLFACLGGDGVDNHVKHRSALLAAKSSPGDQWLLYEYYLGLFAHKVIAMISGNHDAWTEGFAGLDMVQWIAKKNRVCYAPAEAHLDVDVGGQEYLISFRHQYRMNSTFNETHAPKQWLRHGDRLFDVGCVCHHHSPAMEECLIMGDHRIFCRPGSYQITSSHSRQYGYNLTTPTCPTVVFYPGERSCQIPKDGIR